MKLTVQDGDGPERDVSNAVLLIKDQLQELRRLRRARPPDADNSYINQDIRIYEYILSRSDVVIAAHLYLDTISTMREQKGITGVKKIEVMKFLGWDVK